MVVIYYGYPLILNEGQNLLFIMITNIHTGVAMGIITSLINNI